MAHPGFEMQWLIKGYKLCEKLENVALWKHVLGVSGHPPVPIQDWLPFLKHFITHIILGDSFAH